MRLYEEHNERGIEWQLSQDFFPYIDTTLTLHGVLLVDVWFFCLMGELLGICYKLVFFCDLLCIVGTQFHVNMVLIFLCYGVYPHGVFLESYLLCFEIPKHTK
jgi:hypothetical protein